MSSNRPVGDPAIDAQVGRNIRAARKAAELTTIDLGERLGVDPSTITHWERGANRLRVSGLCAVASALEVDVRDLLPDGRRA